MTIIYISSERERSGKTSFVTTLAKKLTTAGKKVTIIIPPDMNGSDTHVTDLMIKDLLSTVPENEFPKIRSDISLDSSGLTTIKSLAATNDYDSSVCLIEEPSSQTTINPSELLASLDAICLDIVKFHAEKIVFNSRSGIHDRSMIFEHKDLINVTKNDPVRWGTMYN